MNEAAGRWGKAVKGGDPFIWLTGGALVLSLLMVAGLLALIMVKGLGFFWPSDLLSVTMKDGTRLLGLQTGREVIPRPGEEEAVENYRIQLKTGNRDLYGLDFRWIDEAEIAGIDRPESAVVIERREWGNFHGFLREVRRGDRLLAQGEEESWLLVRESLPETEKIRARVEDLEKGEINRVSYRLERLERRLGKVKGKEKVAVGEEIAGLKERILDIEGELASLYSGLRKDTLVTETVDGQKGELAIGDIVRIYRPNSMERVDKAMLYGERFWEFMSGYPRESNTEGGVFPAIFGTVMMVLIMTIAVLPLGVVSAVYLREYARQGTVVRIVRICVNNLAGVPSIVFGVFGLGFFIYGLGGSIDRVFFSEALPTPTFGTGGILWASLTLALLTLPVVIVATEEGLAAVPQETRHGSLALGANKFETLIKVVIPAAAPGIFTGLILAVARATGEVAPLMITGVVKLAPSLPLDGNFPYLHLERKFMHLGFHIYDVGFQSPNVEAAMPMVYTTTFLLIVIVVMLNLGAIAIRNHLRRKYSSSVF
jgi:phosphate transport system permease protein